MMAAALLAVACTGGSDDVNDVDEGVAGLLVRDGTLTVATSATRKPFAFTKDGEPAGFEIELMDEIADGLGVPVTYVDTPFGALFNALDDGAADAALATIEITPEREASVAFSRPYFVVHQVIVAPTGSEIAGIKDLADRSVAVQAASPSLRWAEEHAPGSAQLIAFPSLDGVLVAVSQGAAQAAIIGGPDATDALANSDDLTVAAELDAQEQYGVATAADADELTAAIDEQIDAIVSGGTYARLYRRWFAGPVPSELKPTDS